MKTRKAKTRTPIQAAGGIVLRGAREPQFAVVQLRKMGAWVLPKGKLAADEDAMAAARREVLEETGHRVAVHEFLGTLAYEVSGRPKVVQFWRMQALGEPVCALTRDVKAVQWLALKDAIDRLTHPREQAFLEQVGPMALRSTERSTRRATSKERPVGKNVVDGTPSTAGVAGIERSEPFAPAAGKHPVEHVEPAEQDMDERAGLVPAAYAAAAALPVRTRKATATEAAGRSLIEKTLVWFRHVATPDRQSLD